MSKDRCKCGKKRYGYGDGLHEIWLCYACGKFIGQAGGDAFFAQMAKEHPEIILTMVQEKLLTPISKKNKHGNHR